MIKILYIILICVSLASCASNEKEKENTNLNTESVQGGGQVGGISSENGSQSEYNLESGLDFNP